MTTTETEIAETLTTADQLLERRFAADVDVNRSKRIIEGIIFPFDTPAWVADPPALVPYQEQMARGCASRQMKAPNRVFFDFEHHSHDIGQTLGFGQMLAEAAEGLVGSFKVRSGDRGDAALELADEGALGGFSAEFAPKKSDKVGDVMVRKLIFLKNVALVREPAYPQAVVTAIRQAQDEAAEAEAQAVIETTGVPLFRQDLAESLAAFVDVPVELRGLTRAFTEQPWDGAASRWDTPEAYCSSCLIDDNPAGAPKSKALCHLPIREPGSGDVNINAVRNALARVGQVATSTAKRSQARARLERLLAQFNAQ